MRVVTANIRNNPDMARTKVAGDAHEVSRLGAVAFFQEIAERQDQQDMLRGLGPTWEVVNDYVAVPIGFKSRYWRLADSSLLPANLKVRGTAKCHGGRRGASPARYVSWAVLQLKSRPDLQPIVFMNTHFVSGAWNRKPKLFKKWRRRMWQRHWEVMRELVRRFEDAGFTVIFGGDFNRVDVPRFSQNQRWFVNGGIDKLGCVEAEKGAKVKLIEVDRHNLNSDHDARSARVTFHR